MTVLLRKEIRSLLPTWISTMAATVLIAFVQPKWAPMLMILIAVGVVLLGITSFGSEFSQGTFSLLLAQPMPRNRIWWMKTLTLGAAFLSIAVTVWAVFFCQLLLRSGDVLFRVDDLAMPAIFTLLLFGAAFAGGLFSALATRQMATAFWIALLGPIAVWSAAAILTMDRSEKTINISMAASLAVYDVLAFILARRQFMRAQDLPGAAGTVISLPAWMRFGPKNRFATTSLLRSPVRSLIVKELQSHQVSLLFAVILFVLHVIVLFIRWRIFNPENSWNPLYEALGTWWILWLIVPVIIAGPAIAEERRQGTLEGSLCLPAGKGAQWFIKCVVCFFLAVLLGGVMPWLLESSTQLTGHPAPIFKNPSPFTDPWHFLGFTTEIAALITLITFYASSLSRSLLQAIGVGILVASVFGWLAVQVAGWENSVNPGQGVLSLPDDLVRFGLPVFFVTLLWLSYTNFKHVTVGRRMWLVNALALVIVVVLVFGFVLLFWGLARYLYPLPPWALFHG